MSKKKKTKEAAPTTDAENEISPAQPEGTTQGDADIETDQPTEELAAVQNDPTDDKPQVRMSRTPRRPRPSRPLTPSFPKPTRPCPTNSRARSSGCGAKRTSWKPGVVSSLPG